jgi:potassium-transporting ATPase KdpC subunit
MATATPFRIHLRTALIATLVLSALFGLGYPLLVYGAAQLLFPAKANGSLIAKGGTVIGSALIGQNFSDVKYFHPRPSAAGNGYDPTQSGGANLGPLSAKFFNGTTKQPAPPAPPAGADAAPPAAAPAAAPATVATSAAAPAAAPGPGPAAAPAPALVVDFDGIQLRVLHYCDDNDLPYILLRDGKQVSAETFNPPAIGWDEVKLITAFNDADHPLTVKATLAIPADSVTGSASGLDPHISMANALMQARRVAKARNLDVQAVAALIRSATEGPDLGLLGDAGVNVLRLNLALDAHK